jgi:hypothetical protein
MPLMHSTDSYHLLYIDCEIMKRTEKIPPIIAKNNALPNSRVFVVLLLEQGKDHPSPNQMSCNDQCKSRYKWQD